MDVFHKKSWMSPVATASSTGTEEVSDVTDDDTSLSGKCTYYNVTFFCVFHYLRMIENPFFLYSYPFFSFVNYIHSKLKNFSTFYTYKAHINKDIKLIIH